MRRNLLGALLFLLWPMVTKAQSPLLRLTATSHRGAVAVYLSRFDFYEAVVTDSINAGAGRQVILGRTAPSIGLGMYLLELNGQPQYLILDGSSTQNIQAKWADSTWQVLCSGQREQDALNVLLHLSKEFAEHMDSLDAVIESVSDFHPRHDSIISSLDASAKEMMRSFNASIGLIPILFSGTYTARALVPLDHIVQRSEKPERLIQFDSDMAFNHVHYLENVPWNESGLLTNPFLAQKVMTWLAEYCGHSEEEILVSIDSLMEKAKANPPLRKALVRMLTAFFHQKGADSLARSIEQHYPNR